ncbi:E3 ubiquitin-protein ligase RBBP6-like [Dendronephthya gigantea]|uniref:E3 ubiquitin-protein ligase RBBP6-like n=1 Tax=Dendronephthya gigantea TaxID=151771 RepID=UPI00106CA249|nr:E3 ubiquitin-protein ligase RBBP6-like [Dendronephthya gigantea]
MTSQNDCWFFYNSTCAKGDDCPFRHEPLAMGKSVCESWSAGSCNRNPCRFRHSNVEVVKSTAQCYYENQPTGCLNSSCQYTHSKPRPLLTNFNTRSLPTRPILNVPLQSRFPPNSQMFRGNIFTSASMTAPRQTMHNPLLNHPPPHLAGGLPPPPVFPNNSFQIGRPNLFNQNHPLLSLTHTPPSATRPNVAKPFMRGPGETPISLPHPIMEGNTSSTQALPSPSLADLIRPSTGDGLLPIPTPSVLPFSLGGLFPRNMISPKQVSNKKKSRSSAKTSYKRTVKKYEGIRSRKNDKQSKHRNNKKKPQDSNIEKKKKRNSNKAEKVKNRKMKQGHSASKSKKSIGMHDSETMTDVTSVDVIDKNVEDEEDTYEEINLGFKVKTLEEILRDKALKKFLERQMASMGSNSEDEVTVRQKSGTSSSESIDTNVLKPSIIDSTDEVRDTEKAVQTKTSKLKIKKLKPLKPLKPLQNTKGKDEILPVENITSKTEQNQCGDQKKPLPPLKRLKPLATTIRKENSGNKVLKRKLKASPDDVQTIPSKKLQKIETVIVGDDSTSSGDVAILVDAATKTANKTCEDVESLKKQDISPMNVDKSQRTPKRTIVLLQSRDRYKLVGAKSAQVDNVQELSNRDKTKLHQLAEQDKVPEEKTSQNDEGNNSKNKKIGLQKVVSKEISPNGGGKLLGKVIKLNPSKDTNDAASPLSVNLRLSKSRNNVAKGIRTSAPPGITATNNAAENVNKQVLNEGVNQVIKQDIDIKTSDDDTAVQMSKKPTKMIKLNRKRLTEENNDSRKYGGKPRIQFSSLGRIMKINAKTATSKQAVVKPVSVQSTELSNQGNTTSTNIEKKNSKSNVKHEAEVKPTATSQNTTAPVNINNMPTCGETKSMSNDKAAKTYKMEKAIIKPICRTVTKLQTSSNLSHKEQAGGESSAFATINSGTKHKGDQDQLHAGSCRVLQTGLNKEENKTIPVTKLKKTSPQPNIQDANLPMLSRKILQKEEATDPKTLKLEKISSEEEKEDSLDRLFEEVSKDVEDEGEDFLNEALEKAIAELSPVNTDDEEDVSNADDLLLEIEEMII